MSDFPGMRFVPTLGRGVWVADPDYNPRGCRIDNAALNRLPAAEKIRAGRLPLLVFHDKFCLNGVQCSTRPAEDDEDDDED